MSDSSTPLHANPPYPASVSPKPTPLYLHVLDILIAIARRRWWPLAGAAVAVCLASLYLSTQTTRYTALTRLLPPQVRQNSATMLTQTGSLTGAGLANTFNGQKPVLDSYVAILKSRSAAIFVSDTLGLKHRWKLNNNDAIAERLSLRVAVDVGVNDIINILVDDEDPRWSAAMANTYVKALQHITQQIAVTEASKRKVFFEQQMREARDRLAVAEVELKRIQQRTGVLRLDGQVQQAMEEISRVRGEISVKEAALTAMAAFATPLNPDYIRLNHEIEALKEELTRLQAAPIAQKIDVAAAPGSTATATPGSLPESGLTYARQMREVKTLEHIYELFIRELQLTRIDEVKDVILIEPLDIATPPAAPSFPRPRRTLTLAVIAGLLAGALAVVVRELLSRALKDTTLRQKLKLLGLALCGKAPLP